MNDKIETVWRSSPEQIAEMRATLPDYWEPIIDAMAHHGVAILLIEPSPDPFEMKSAVPLITVIGDDYPEELGGSEGPMRYDRDSMVEHWRAAEAAVIVAGAANIGCYAAAASVAILLRKNAILVETSPEHQEEWTQLALYCGISRLLVVTPEPLAMDVGLPPGGKPH